MTLRTVAVGCAALLLLSTGDRLVADSPGEVSTFAGNAQHTGIYLPAAVDINTIKWSTSIDLRQTFGTTHYGAPLVTASNTIIVPVKTASDGFQIKVLDGATGKPRYGTIDTDYVLPPHNWIPTYAPAVAIMPDRGGQRRLYYPGAGGTLFYIDNPDISRHRSPARVAFYGLEAFERDRAAFTSSVFVNTPITADSRGNVYFGFRVQGTAPAPLSTTQSGFVRIAPDGSSTYVLAGVAAGDTAVTRDSHNSAPALSIDEQTLYVVAKSGTTNAYAYLIALNPVSLATKSKVFLRDPRNNHANSASVTDDSTASPMVAPDGDVYFGVLANPNNGSRGFLLRFSGNLATEKDPGGFGWDSTAAVVPAAMVPSYRGSSTYLIFTKYNNYRFSDGDGVNRIALLDPDSRQFDPHPSANGLVEMLEVLTVVGPTPDGPLITPTSPFAVREWCINTAAVNPATKSIFVPNEDGRLYRWNLETNSLSQAVALTPGYGEPYVPTIVGPDGTVFTLNGGTLFAVGSDHRATMTISSSRPDTNSVFAGNPLTFTATVTARVRSRLFPLRGAVVFRDLYYPIGSATAIETELGRVPMTDGAAAYGSAVLPAGTHIITAMHDGSGARASFVQKVHAYPTEMQLTSRLDPPSYEITATVTAQVGQPTGLVTFQRELANFLNTSAITTMTYRTIGTNTVFATYASDPVYASSKACLIVSGGGPPCSQFLAGPTQGLLRRR